MNARTLLYKTNDKDPKKRENYWMMALKTYVPFGLNIEDSVSPILCRIINTTGVLTFLVFLAYWLDQVRFRTRHCLWYCLFPYY